MNSDKLKSAMKKKSIETGIPAQLLLQNFMLERFLERISESKFNNNFILKRGDLFECI